MKGKRLLAMVMTLCLIVGAMPMAMAAGAKPIVTLEVSKIVQDHTVEVGLNVTATDFKSVGAVIEIDTTKLAPIYWDGETKEAVSIPTEATSWSNYATLPAKGADKAGAKPALAFQNGDKLVIYFGADAFATVDSLANERMATLRFKLVGDDEVAAFGELTEATVANYISISKTPEDIIRMTGGAVQVLCGTGLGSSAYRYNAVKNDATSGPILDTAYNTDLTLAKDTEVKNEVREDGKSQAGSGTAVASYGVTFLDWDGSVLLTAAIAQQDDVTGLIGYTAAGDAVSWGSMIEENGALKQALSGKAGYDFDCWLDYKALDAQAPFTSNNTALDQSSEANKKYVVDLTHFKDEVGAARTGITLQAAYKGNSDLKLKNMGGDYSFGAAPYFIRYGAASANAGKYGIRLSAERGLAERGRDTGVIVSMEPKAGQPLFSYQSVVSGDSMSFEIVPTKDMNKVSFALVDIYGAPSWINGGVRTGAYRDIEMTEVIQKGSANFIMEQAILKNSGAVSEWDLNVDAQAFLDAGVAVTDLTSAKNTVLGNMNGMTEPVDYATFQGWF